MSATTPVRPDPAAWHHQHTVRVYWEDTDAGGIVFYGNYLKFMERARTEWLRTIGFEQETMRKAGEGMFIVADTQLRYLRPAKLDDLLTVSVTIREIGRVSVVFEQTVWRGDTLLTQGQIRIGWVEPGRRTPHPRQIRIRTPSVLGAFLRASWRACPRRNPLLEVELS